MLVATFSARLGKCDRGEKVHFSISDMHDAVLRSSNNGRQDESPGLRHREIAGCPSAVSSLDSYSKDSYSSPFYRFEYESSLDGSSTSLENFQFILVKFKIFLVKLDSN